MAVAPSTASESAKDPGHCESTVTPQRPIRTCIGCRQRAAAAELLRVVAGPDGMIVPDPRRRTPGRGAWLHPDQRCVELAERRRAFARALRVSGPVDPTPVGEYVAQAAQPPAESGGALSPSGTPQERSN
jgi:predicted RNA-binding protein YlxR (DUF448 family)